MGMALSAEISVSSTGTGSVVVDGVDVSSKTAALELRVRPGHLTELSLDLRPRTVTVAGEVAVVLGDELQALLIKLGWTPPAAPGLAKNEGN